MKTTIKLAYHIYHLLFPSRFAACRYRPTCSKYTVDAIEKYGLLKGLHLASKRILSCHPFSTRPIYDPV